MEIGADPYWLTFTGVNGCGKTMLAKQVFEQAKRVNPGNPANNPIWPPDALERSTEGVNVYEPSRPYCIWLKEGELAQRMRGGEYNLPEDLSGDYLVALDELGISRDPTNFVSEAVGRLCDFRINKWSIFCTNFTLNEIRDRMDGRIASRLIRDGNTVVQITAGDYALRASNSPKSANSHIVSSEPSKWREWLKTAYPDESWADTASRRDWSALPSNWQTKIRREMGA